MSEKRPWKKTTGAVIVFTALAFVPLIYSSILTNSNIDPTGHLDTVPAAVVNEDEGATDPDGEQLDVGDELADTLLESTESNNFDWIEMSAEQARGALDDGGVYATLTIPADFSEKVVSVGDDDAAKAASAKLDVRTNDGLNMISGNIASSIGTAVTDSLRDEVSSEYLEKIYLGFTDVHSSLVDAADGATQVAEGASDAEDGSGELVVGLRQLHDGAARLEDGAWRLVAGADQAAAGASQLADGLGELRSKTASLPDLTAQLNDGAQQVADGTAQLSDQLDQVVAQVQPVIDAVSDLADRLQDIRDGIDETAGAAEQVADGADQTLTDAQSVRDEAADAAAQSGDVSAGAEGVRDGLQGLIDGYATMSDTERMAALEKLTGDADGVVASAAQAADASSGASDNAGRLVGDGSGGLTQLASSADGFASGAQDVKSTVDEIGDDIDQVLADAQQKLEQARQAVDGVHSLRDGSAQVADGTRRLAAQTPQLAGGIATAADGAGELSGGTSQLASGLHDLADGASSAATGSESAAEGVDTLNDGLGDLADGSGDLRDGLEDGVDEVPSYTEGEAKHLGGVAASQVTLDSERLNEVAGYGAGLAPYFLSLALWVGGMSFYMMAPAMNAAALSRRRPAALLTLRSLMAGVIMGVIQATIAVASLHFWVGVEAANLPGLFALAAFASITFLAINQALVAMFGSPGRFVALVMVVLQLASAGGTYPVETAPAFYQWIHNALPITHTVEAFRALIAGGGIGIGLAIGVLAIWLAGALALSFAASIVALRKERRDAVDEKLGEQVPDVAATPAVLAATAVGSAKADASDAPTQAFAPVAAAAVLDRPAPANDDAQITSQEGVEPVDALEGDAEADVDAGAAAEPSADSENTQPTASAEERSASARSATQDRAESPDEPSAASDEAPGADSNGVEQCDDDPAPEPETESAEPDDEERG
ncbi:YhgE/Pip domain-containing protein [Microbacterium halotolerans]|uniref:YhgE/Pip domain-containing protein n=1 Tax=Microbacterium halotolerans TaxID=246613 RepID=UPI000E6ACEB9|nr:YhgE/Pip domain-containing protein [Microbacterium halotolerans]